MSDNVFSNPEATDKPNSAAPTGAAPSGQEGSSAKPTDPTTLFADQLAGIKTADGRQKYADVPTALSGLAHAQNHITDLTNRLKDLEEQMAKAKGMEEVLDRINSANKTGSEQPSVKGLSEADVASLLERMLNEKESSSKANENETRFSQQLVKLYGDKATEMMKAKANELGISVDFLRSVVQKSPKAALAYFTDKEIEDASPTTKGLNTAAFQKSPQTNNSLEEARSKLFGKDNSLVSKWRAAARKDN